MNNFDPDIAAWRRQLIAAGIKSAEVLDELESHLREDIERRDSSRAAMLPICLSGGCSIRRPQSLKAGI